MQLTPLLDQTQGARRNASGDDIAGPDRDHDGLAGVRRVEMRHAVLAIVHRDDDPVELAINQEQVDRRGSYETRKPPSSAPLARAWRERSARHDERSEERADRTRRRYALTARHSAACADGSGHLQHYEDGRSDHRGLGQALGHGCKPITNPRPGLRALSACPRSSLRRQEGNPRMDLPVRGLRGSLLWRRPIV